MRKIAAERSLADQAASQIRQEIITGRFAPGQRLQETALAEALGVSRGPVREAMKLLKAEGFVRDEHNRGTFVTSLSPTDVGEIFEVRLAVETRAAKLIMRGQREADLASLQQHAEWIIEAAASGDDRKIAQADVDFHEAICHLSGVGRLREIFHQHVGLWRALLLVDEHLYPVVADTSDEHYGILRAIQSGDESLATRTIESHLERSKERLVGYLESRPALRADLSTQTEPTLTDLDYLDGQRVVDSISP
jgi:GntR family transcriptional regulator, gluconate operon transcriptional repressor